VKVDTATPGAPSALDVAYATGLTRALGAAATFHCALVVKLVRVGVLTHMDVVRLLDGVHAHAEQIGDSSPDHVELRDAIFELLALQRRSLLGDGAEGKPGDIIGGEDLTIGGGR
jgi:hypothetical protein